MSHRLDPQFKTPKIADMSIDNCYLAADHVLLRLPEKQDKTEGGILIPESAKQQHQLCEIVKVGSTTDEVIRYKGLSTPQVGMLIVLSDHMVEDPDFELADARYRIVAWEDLTHVWIR